MIFKPSLCLVGNQMIQREHPKRMFVSFQEIPSITATTDTFTYQGGQVFTMWENEMSVLVNFRSFSTRSRNKMNTKTIHAGFDSVSDLTHEYRDQGLMYGRTYTMI
jgi:hypothetical protein